MMRNNRMWIRRTRLARVASLGFFVVNFILLIAYHVRAESSHNRNDDNMSSSSLSPFREWTERIRTQGPAGLSSMDKLVLAVLVSLGFELLDFVAKNWGKWLGSKQIPVRGKHLDVLRPVDILCIGFSKANTAPFTYFYFRYAYFAPNVVFHNSKNADDTPASPQEECWWSSLTLLNTLGSLVALFLVFDFVYTILHWFLHIKGIYGYIHKHHHVQKAPSRAVIDAINVHPVEYLSGEYNHILALHVVNQVLGVPVHAATTLVFLIVGGMLAALNHTRYDLVVALPIVAPGGRWWWYNNNDNNDSSSSSKRIVLYDSKVHDVHHRIPQSNYGQYTMFWDHVFGSFRAYDPKDRINPDAQLDPRTGKSLEYQKLRLKSQ